MTTGAAILMLLAQQAPAGAVPPRAFAVRPVSPDAAMSELVVMCIRPRWNRAAMDAAAARSAAEYTPEDEGAASTTSFRWRSRHAYLGLDLPGGRFNRDALCSLSIAITEARTPQQIMATAKPVVEREIGRKVQYSGDGLALEWRDDQPNRLNRLSLVSKDREPSQALWYLFERVIIDRQKEEKQ